MFLTNQWDMWFLWRPSCRYCQTLIGQKSGLQAIRLCCGNLPKLAMNWLVIRRKKLWSLKDFYLLGLPSSKNMQGQCVPEQCVPKRKVSDVPSLGQCVPCTMRPLDNASLGQCVPWTMRPLDNASLGQCVPLTMRPLDISSLTIASWPWPGACQDKFNVCLSAPLQNLTQQKVSLSQCKRIHQSGMHYLRNASSKGQIVQGTQNPGDKKSQTDHPGAHCSGIQHPVILCQTGMKSRSSKRCTVADVIKILGR